MNPMPATLVFAAMSAMRVPWAARAQPNTTPVLRITSIPMMDNLISVDALESDKIFHLKWSATVSVQSTYGYELSYDDTATILMPNVALVPLDRSPNNNDGRNPGEVISDRMEDFTIRASQIATPTWLVEHSELSRTLVLRIFLVEDRLNLMTTATGGWVFTIAAKPPPAPLITRIEAGPRTLTIAWSPPSEATVPVSFEVLLCPDVRQTIGATESITGLSHRPVLPCNQPVTAASLPGTTLTTRIEGTGLQDGVPAAVALRSVDVFGNRGAIGNVAIGVPIAAGMLAPSKVGCGCAASESNACNTSTNACLSVCLIVTVAARGNRLRRRPA